MHALRSVRAAIASAVALLAAATAVATTVEKLDLAGLVAAADAIVIGRARGAETVWVGRNLYTRYRVEVEQSLLGAAATEVAVLVPGGIDARGKHPIALVVPYAPMLTRDEHVALFLEETNFPATGDFTIVGFNQGRITLGGASAAPANGAQRLAAGGDGAAGDAQANQLREQLAPLLAARGAAPVAAPASRILPGIRGGAQPNEEAAR